MGKRREEEEGEEDDEGESPAPPELFTCTADSSPPLPPCPEPLPIPRAPSAPVPTPFPDLGNPGSSTVSGLGPGSGLSRSPGAGPASTDEGVSPSGLEYPSAGARARGDSLRGRF